MKYEVISPFVYDNKQYNIGDEFPKNKVKHNPETVDAKADTFDGKIKKVCKNTYKVPCADGCTGEMYYLKDGIKSDHGDMKDLVNKAFKPKYKLDCVPVLDANKKVIYYLHETDDELQHTDCIKLNKDKELK